MEKPEESQDWLWGPVNHLILDSGNGPRAFHLRDRKYRVVYLYDVICPKISETRQIKQVSSSVFSPLCAPNFASTISVPEVGFSLTPHNVTDAKSTAVPTLLGVKELHRPAILQGRAKSSGFPCLPYRPSLMRISINFTIKMPRTEQNSHLQLDGLLHLYIKVRQASWRYQPTSWAVSSGSSSSRVIRAGLGFSLSLVSCSMLPKKGKLALCTRYA